MSIRGNDNPNFCFEDGPAHQENQRPEKCVVSELEAADITPVPKHAEDGDSSDLYFEDKECEGDRLGRLIEQFWAGVSSLVSKHQNIVKPFIIIRYISTFISNNVLIETLIPVSSSSTMRT